MARDRIMTLLAEELPTFSLKTSKTFNLEIYSISPISGRGPLKILLWPTGLDMRP